MRSSPSSSLATPAIHNAIADIGCNSHFFKIDSPCESVQPAKQPIYVQLPDGRKIISAHTGTIPISVLTPAARQAHMLPTLKTGSLVSIGQLCDSGCITKFNRQLVKIHHNNKLIMQGPRTANGIWTVPVQAVPQSVPPIANLTMSTLAMKTAQDCVAFLHTAAGYPVVSTWIQVIHNGGLVYLCKLSRITSQSP